MKDLLNDLIDQAYNLNKLFNNLNYKVIITFFALLFSILIYIYVVNFYGQDFSILNNFHLHKREYKFYSGSKELTYYQVGEALATNHPQNIKITNMETDGSYDNAWKIITDDTPAIGLAQKT